MLGKIGEKGPLLLGREHESGLSAGDIGESGEDPAVESEVGGAHMRALDGSRESESELAEAGCWIHASAFLSAGECNLRGRGPGRL